MLLVPVQAPVWFFVQCWPTVWDESWQCQHCSCRQLLCNDWDWIQKQIFGRCITKDRRSRAAFNNDLPQIKVKEWVLFTTMKHQLYKDTLLVMYSWDTHWSNEKMIPALLYSELYRAYPGKRSCLKYCKDKPNSVLNYAKYQKFWFVEEKGFKQFFLMFILQLSDNAVRDMWWHFFPDGVQQIFLWLGNGFSFLGEVFLGEFSPCLFFYSFSLPYLAQHPEIPLELVHLLAWLF